MRTLRRARILFALAGLCGFLGLAGTPTYAATPVSYQELLVQVRSGPLIRAIINGPRGDIEIKFRDLSEWEAFYPPGAEHTLVQLIRRRHIRLLFVRRHPTARAKPTSTHHHLRYIAAAVIGALMVVGAVLLGYRRRRRQAPAA